MTTAENFHARIDAILLVLLFTHGTSNKRNTLRACPHKVKGTSDKYYHLCEQFIRATNSPGQSVLHYRLNQ